MIAASLRAAYDVLSYVLNLCTELYACTPFVVYADYYVVF